VSLKGDLV